MLPPISIELYYTFLFPPTSYADVVAGPSTISAF